MTQDILHLSTPGPWWRSAVIYQIYPRSFASDGGPFGTLRGITERLDHVQSLGVDAIWLSPFYKSPQKDHGYDVADYRSVDPTYGTLADADHLITEANERGLRVMVDLVPNHSSSEHEWFQAALAAGPGSPERDRYWFREGRGPDGSEPPTDWTSVFGGPAWTRVSDGQWYLHMFDTTQPDFNWDHPEVRAEFHDILRFWLERGVDGFRVDVAHGLVKDPSLPDWQFHWDMVSGDADEPADTPPPPMWDQDGVHEIYRGWREVLEEFEGDRMMCGEVWVDDDERRSRYVRDDEMQQAFNFNFLACPWNAVDIDAAIERSFEANDAVGAPTTWVLGNHDVVRVASRMGLPVTGKGPNGIRPGDPQPDPELGLQRALSATALMLALPGSAYIYNGDELGLPEHMDLPAAAREDPAFFRTEGEEAGRDGCRIPLPWDSEAPGAGFSPDGSTWLPQPEKWEQYAVNVQREDPHSVLALTTELVQRRAELGLGSGTFSRVSASPSGLHYVNTGSDDSLNESPVHIVTSFDEPMRVSGSWEVIIATSDISDDDEDVTLEPHTTAWLRQR